MLQLRSPYSRPGPSAPRRTWASLAVSALLLSHAQLGCAQAVAPAPPEAAGADAKAVEGLAQGANGPDAAASAAAPAQPGSSATREALTTVVVTATRRREPTRDVPMQVDAISTAKLQQEGARTLSDYLGSDPGVDVKTGGGAGLGSITIRGVSTGNQTIATVGTYIDDAAVGSTNAFANGSTSALDMALLDLNHIELLRGPQGTLYGAGAMGGVLKYVTNEPDTAELSGQATVSAAFTRGGRLSHTESGVVNVPLKEDVAGLRVSAFTDREGGWVDAVGALPGRDVNSGRTSGGRVSLLLEPSARWKVRLTDTNQALQRNGTDAIEVDPATGRPVEGHGTRDRSRREPYLLRTNVATADIEYDFKWARLNAITSVQSSRNDTTVDFTEGYAALLQDAGLDVSSVGYRDQVNVKKTTQEFRLTSPGGGRIDWLAGLFWNRERATNDNVVDSTWSDGTPGPDIVVGTLPSTFRELAAYGDVTWNPTKSFSLTGGLRVARNQQHFAEQGSSLLSGDVDTDSTSAETSKTYLLTGKYALTPTSNVYVRIASGYRPGGPNLMVSPTDPSSFQHDSLWSYEGGYKADLLDRTLSVQAAVYDIHWDNIQQTVSKNGLNVIINSGTANIKGAELSATWQATKSLSLGGNLALVNARLTQAAEGLAVSGSRLPDSARVAGAVSARYTFDLPSRPAYAGLSVNYTGQRNAGFEGSESLPNYKLPSYALTDLQAGVDFKTVQLGLFARNVFDKAAQLSGDTGFVPLGGPVLVTEQRPRTIGVTMTALF